MGKVLKQRGYTLIEIAIVLTVFLIISSAFISNYYNTQQIARQKETEKAIKSIQEAIIDYAASHATVARGLVNTGATINTGISAAHVRWQLPAGRPYLPCPDIDNDGEEDRRALPIALLLTVNAKSSPSVYQTEGGGDCVSIKGTVPWRTLGTLPTDPWGNRYTYRVSHKFSNALIGFDETARDDSTMLTRPLSMTVFNGKEVAVQPELDITAHDSSLGTVNFSQRLTPSVVCSRAPCPGDAAVVTLTSLIAGDVHYNSTATVVLNAPRAAGLEGGVYRSFSKEQQVTDGLPVVIVSHGQNGYGAVRNDVSDFSCNKTPNNDDEIQNAQWPILLGSCSSITLSLSHGHINGFVRRSLTRNASNEFDDIVMWLSSEEIIAGLAARGALPALVLPPFGTEDTP